MFVLSKHLQPHPVFADTARNLFLGGSTYFILTSNHQTRLKRLKGGKHSNLICLFFLMRLSLFYFLSFKTLIGVMLSFHLTSFNRHVIMEKKNAKTHWMFNSSINFLFQHFTILLISILLSSILSIGYFSSKGSSFYNFYQVVVSSTHLFIN